MCRKLRKRGQRPAWVNKGLMTELKCKKEVFRSREQGQDSSQEYREVALAYRGGFRKVIAQLELKLARDVKGNNRGFCTYATNRIKTTESKGLLFNGARDQMTKDEDKAVAENSQHGISIYP